MPRVSRREKLQVRLAMEEEDLRQTLIPILRSIAAGRNTGFFDMGSGKPTVLAEPILVKARDILELATQLGEPNTDLVAAAVLRAFEHANDRTNEHRLGPIRLARRLIEEVDAP